MMIKCSSREEDVQLLWNIHSGICGSHSSWGSIISKAFRHGFYWHIAKYVAIEIVTKMQGLPVLSKQIIKHAKPLRPIDLSWSFTKWGMDIVGVLPKAPGGFRFLFVAIDMFTK
jgi:hypothetical protein